jgi:hypothetical protein
VIGSSITGVFLMGDALIIGAAGVGRHTAGGFHEKLTLE